MCWLALESMHLKQTIKTREDKFQIVKNYDVIVEFSAFELIND